MSAAPSFILSEDLGDGLTVLTLVREPVNSMNLELWEQLGAALERLQLDPSVRAVVICSGLKKDVFTAGNDIRELYSPMTDEARYTRFWIAQTRCLARLLVSPLVTVAAVRGQCPAGGCVLAMCCDARVLSENSKIGLNEVALGIPVPRYWAKLMQVLVGGRSDTLLQTAALVSAPDALTFGLADAIAPSTQVLSVACAQARARLAFPDAGRKETKRMLRSEFAEAWQAFAEEEAKQGWRGISTPEITRALGQVLERLKDGKPSKSKL